MSFFKILDTYYKNSFIMITTEQYNQHLKSWKGTIYKTMFKLSQINQLDYSYQQDLLQVGKIAIYEALIASETNGKTGNDKNGIIAAYIDGKMKTFAVRHTNLIRIPTRMAYNQEYREKNEHFIPLIEPAEWHQDETEDFNDDNSIDDMNWIDNQAIKYMMNKLSEIQQKIIKHKYNLDGYEQLTQQQIADKYNITVSMINNTMAYAISIAQDRQVRLQAKQRKKYGKTIQSTS